MAEPNQQWGFDPGALIDMGAPARVSVDGPGCDQVLSFDGMHVERVEVVQGPGGAVVTVTLGRQRFVIGAPADG